MNYYSQYEEMLNAHILIAGRTGCGKSVLIDNLIYTIAATHPTHEAGIVLIDPKKVELVKWSRLPHCIRYADELPEIIQTLKSVVETMQNRFTKMKRQGVNKWDGASIYIVIDELGDLMTIARGDALPLLQRIAQLGRAAKIYLIAASQSPSRKVIPAELQINFTKKIALHCQTATESRQIIGVPGAECLPVYGLGLYQEPSGELSEIEIEILPEEEKNKLIAYRTATSPKKTLTFFDIFDRIFKK